MSQATGKVASSLCSAVLDFWSLLLRQESWALVSKPGPPSTDEMVDEDCGGSPPDIDMDSLSNELESQESQKDSWKLERFLLNEERDRLRLWKFNVTDDDLDRLTETQPCVFGGAVVQCLVSIGQALINEADIPSCGDSIHELEARKKDLESLITQGSRLVRTAYYDDDAAETLGSTGYDASVMTDFTVPDDKPANLHEILKNDIGKLQRLSFSISQTLAIMNLEAE